MKILTTGGTGFIGSHLADFLISKKVSKKLLRVLDMAHYDEFFNFGNDYYNLDNELLGEETYEYCPNEDKIPHDGNYSIWNTVNHGKICLVCNKVWKRKEKLYQISKSK